ncbi:MAG: hypothetical protein GX055_09235 [Desulfovibrionales bacterium]|nr:hypothetical protein [Desulfovibrionales bacterium]
MHLHWITAFLCIVLGAAQARADQRVDIMTNSTDTAYEQFVNQGLEQAITQEIAALLPAVSPERLNALAAHLHTGRDALILGYSDVTALSNATDGHLVLDVRTNTDAIYTYLRDMGVLYTASGPKPYGLILDGVEPGRTKRLGPLQELSGLRPTGAVRADMPVLRLAQEPPGAWTGVLTQGEWSVTRTAKVLDDVWFGLWQEFFARPEAALTQTDGTVMVRVSGWVSSIGPMQFDTLMNSWSAEIVRKELIKVDMDTLGLAALWSVQPRNLDALRAQLQNAAQAQGLHVEIE